MAYPNDDSCPKCGELSSDGRLHTVCPSECGTCGYVGFPSGRGCPACYAWNTFKEMTNDEKLCMKELLE